MPSPYDGPDGGPTGRDVGEDVPHSRRPGEELGGRYRLVDLLHESTGGRFWRAHDRVLSRHVAIHVIAADDPRAEGLLEAARSSAAVQDRRILRVLDAERDDHQVYVVHEWGSGTSLDLVLSEGPLGPRRAAWVVAEAAEAVAAAHAAGIAHGRLAPENVLLDHGGHVRLIGLAVDAALHGLPPGRLDQDLVDLAGLLYAGMTARWAGASRSAVEAAPRRAGRVLRPRKVRAGVPRTLDQLCDELLNDGPTTGTGTPGHATPSSAREVAALLHDFVGDPVGMAAALASAAGPARRHAAPGLSAPGGAAEVDRADGATEVVEVIEADEADEAEADRTDAPAIDEPTRVVPLAAGATDLPTQAGVPIFHEGDEDVEWLRARSEKPPPPPPFEDPPERPLFAPDPPPGQPVRRPRPGAAPAPAGDGYWPWRDTGTGRGGPGPGAERVLAEPEPTDGRVPGRRTLRIALVLALVVLLVLAVAFASGLGRGTAPLGLGDDPEPSPDASATPTPAQPVRGLVATDLDPQGDGEENPDLVGLSVDDDPATAWRTLTYEQQLGPGGLKTGLGLVVDLGGEVAPREAEVSVLGGPTTAELYLTDERPDDVDGLEPVGEASGEEQLRWELDGESTARYLVVWLVELPSTADGFRAEVSDVVVRR